MNYLLDKKQKQKRYLKWGALALFLFLLFYFSSGVLNIFSSGTHTIFRPILAVGKGVGNKFSSLSAFFSSKNTLSKENEELKLALLESETKMGNYVVLENENRDLKEILERREGQLNLLVAAILAKPNRSPYDTLVVDVGEDKGVRVGALVFALGNIPIGRVESVYANSANIVLFSSPGQKTEVVISGGNIFAELLGRGGGNFELRLVRDFQIEPMDTVNMPGIHPYTVATVESIISDPRDSFKKALLLAPVNIQNLKFVEIVK